MRKCSLPKLCLLSFLLFTITSHAQSEWIKALNFGDYPVGFKTVYLQDFSRNYKAPLGDAFVPRPMPISIWYPAGKVGKHRRLTFSQYLMLENTTEQLDGADPTTADKIPDQYQVYQPNEMLQMEMNAFLEAPQRDGRFPLIIYSAAQGSAGYENTLLCEQIASYGYIVATVASKGAYSRQMPFNSEGAEAQTRDLEFVYGYLYNHDGVDVEQVGTVGFSFGGLNMVTFSLKNKQVKAMVALDGSIVPGYSILEAYPYLTIKDLNSNFLGFLGDKSSLTDAINTFPLLEDAPLVNAYLLQVKDLVHTDFASSNLMITRRDEKFGTVYADIANLTVRFLNDQFKSTDTFAEVQNDYSREFYSAYREKIAKGTPQVTKLDYIHFIKEKGIDEAVKVYYDTKQKFPDYQLFDYDPFRDVGFLRMMNKDYENAVKIYQVLLDAFPQKPDSYRRLGEAYMLVGEFAKARELLQQGLDLDPTSPALQDILNRLEELEKD